MIISVSELREYITTSLSDEVLESKLSGIEIAIRKITNNNFQNKNKRTVADIIGSRLVFEYPYIIEGDTIQISQSKLNEGLYVYDLYLTLLDEENVLITKIEYPADIKMGVINLIKWDIENRDKVGISSETISRHSVTYSNMDGSNSFMGYPKSLMGFLTPYMKARF